MITRTLNCKFPVSSLSFPSRFMPGSGSGGGVGLFREDCMNVMMIITRKYTWGPLEHHGMEHNTFINHHTSAYPSCVLVSVLDIACTNHYNALQTISHSCSLALHLIPVLFWFALIWCLTETT